MNHLTLDQLAEQSPVATQELIRLRAELAEANARLKAAQEQEPVGFISLSERDSLLKYGIPVVIHPTSENMRSRIALYAAPIPSDRAGESELSILAAIEELSALRAEVGRLVALNDRLIANERRLVESLRTARNVKADRITEQDAREIFNAIEFSLISGESYGADMWLDKTGRTLLNKLNADRVPAVSVPDGWKLVPERPTKEQKDAGSANKIFAGVDVNLERHYVHVTHTEVQDIYERMLSAAPPAMLSASPADGEGE